MQLAVLLEKVSEHRYRATGTTPINLSVEGETEEEAVQNYRDAVSARLLGGSKIMTIDVPEAPVAEHPWAKFAGTLPDDAITEEWRAEIEAARNAEVFVPIEG